MVHEIEIPEPDVRAIRERTGLPQVAFAWVQREFSWHCWTMDEQPEIIQERLGPARS